LRGAVTGGFGGGRQITDGVELRCERLCARDFFMAAPMFNYAVKQSPDFFFDQYLPLFCLDLTAG
jgi:hypothetical protein